MITATLTSEQAIIMSRPCRHDGMDRATHSEWHTWVRTLCPRPSTFVTHEGGTDARPPGTVAPILFFAGELVLGIRRRKYSKLGSALVNFGLSWLAVLKCKKPERRSGPQHRLALAL